MESVNGLPVRANVLSELVKYGITQPTPKLPRYIDHINIRLTNHFCEITTQKKLKHNFRSDLRPSKNRDHLKEADNRAHRTATSIINGNFTVNSKFVTLTFKDSKDLDINNIDECNIRKTQYFRKLKREFPNLKYFTVTEFQKRGAVHYHIICNLPYMDLDRFHRFWPHGYSEIKAIKNLKQASHYLIKYMQKNFKDKRYQGYRRYYTSQNLTRPVLVPDNKKMAILMFITRSHLIPYEEFIYLSPFFGEMRYQSYFLGNAP
jgi:hypothetical protein